MTQNEEITKLENIWLNLKCIREDTRYLSSRIDDTILEVRHMMSELQIKGEETKNE